MRFPNTTAKCWPGRHRDRRADREWLLPIDINLFRITRRQCKELHVRQLVDADTVSEDTAWWRRQCGCRPHWLVLSSVFKERGAERRTVVGNGG